MSARVTSPRADSSGAILRLKNPDGSWIEQPEFMILSALCSPKIEDVEDTYAAMVAMPPRADLKGTKTAWTGPQKAVLGRHVHRDLVHRIRVGAIPWHIAKAHKASGRIPSLASVYEIQADLVLQQQRNRKRENLATSIRKNFVKWRPVAHFLAFQETHGHLLFGAEVGSGSLDLAARIILGWEGYLDVVFASRPTSWQPIRLPKLLEPIHPFDFIDEFDLKASTTQP